MQTTIARAGAVKPLVERLTGQMMQGTTALALRNLAEGNAETQGAIAQATAPPQRFAPREPAQRTGSDDSHRYGLD